MGSGSRTQSSCVEEAKSYYHTKGLPAKYGSTPQVEFEVAREEGARRAAVLALGKCRRKSKPVRKLWFDDGTASDNGVGNGNGSNDGDNNGNGNSCNCLCCCCEGRRQLNDGKPSVDDSCTQKALDAYTLAGGAITDRSEAKLSLIYETVSYNMRTCTDDLASCTEKTKALFIDLYAHLYVDFDVALAEGAKIELEKEWSSCNLQFRQLEGTLHLTACVSLATQAFEAAGGEPLQLDAMLAAVTSSPSSTSTSIATGESNNKEKKGSSAGVIAGAAVGAIVVVGAIGLLLQRQRKQKEQADGMGMAVQLASDEPRL
jgi:hypothetical protein